MVLIRKFKEEEIIIISKILIPAFQDKVSVIVGDDEKALKIIPEIIKSIDGGIFVALEDETIVGAIIVTISKIKFSFAIIKTCFKELGFFKAIKAFKLINNYKRSLPKKNEIEGTLEAIGVLKEFQGQGIGYDLILKGEEFLKENNFKFFGLGVKIDNKAVKLYESMNFQNITNYENKLGNWYYLRKEL